MMAARAQHFSIREHRDGNVIFIYGGSDPQYKGRMVKQRRAAIERARGHGHAFENFISRMRRIGLRWPPPDPAMISYPSIAHIEPETTVVKFGVAKATPPPQVELRPRTAPLALPEPARQEEQLQPPRLRYTAKATVADLELLARRINRLLDSGMGWASIAVTAACSVSTVHNLARHQGKPVSTHMFRQVEVAVTKLEKSSGDPAKTIRSDPSSPPNSTQPDQAFGSSLAALIEQEVELRVAGHKQREQELEEQVLELTAQLERREGDRQQLLDEAMAAAKTAIYKTLGQPARENGND
jgi:hypothetical protein